MGATVYELGGVKYITSGQAAGILGIDQRTVLRWVERVRKGKCPKLLQRLVWMRDPVSGFTYFSEPSVMALRKELLRARPTRR